MSEIEVGDIVERVDSKYNTDYKDKIWCKTEYLLKYIKEDLQNGMKIKSILTHEQYKQNCYRLEE